MNTKRKINVRGNSTLRGMTVGITGCALTTLMSTVIFAWMISKKVIPEENIIYCTMVILLISAITGSKIVTSKCDKKAATGICLGIVYLAMMLIVTTIFFGAQYQRIGVTTIIVLVGCVLAAMLSKSDRKNHKFKKSKTKRC